MPIDLPHGCWPSIAFMQAPRHPSENFEFSNLYAFIPENTNTGSSVSMTRFDKAHTTDCMLTGLIEIGMKNSLTEVLHSIFGLADVWKSQKHSRERRHIPQSVTSRARHYSCGIRTPSTRCKQLTHFNCTRECKIYFRLMPCDIWSEFTEDCALVRARTDRLQA